MRRIGSVSRTDEQILLVFTDAEEGDLFAVWRHAARHADVVPRVEQTGVPARNDTGSNGMATGLIEPMRDLNASRDPSFENRGRPAAPGRRR